MHLKQRGYLLGLFFLMPIILGLASLFFYSLQTPDNAKMLATQDLLQLKNLLIDYAAADLERPGRLPCVADDEGEAQLFSRKVCPQHFGRLPWKTLDWGKTKAHNGQNVFYVLDENFSGDFAAQQYLNPATHASLEYIDQNGKTHTQQVAILFVPRFQMDFKQKPNVIDLRQQEWLAAVGISREELFFKVQKSVANLLLNCLKAHALKKEVPSPSPFAASNFQSHQAARFGRVPEYAQNEGMNLVWADFAQTFDSFPITDLENADFWALNESLYAFQNYANQAFFQYQKLNDWAQKLQKTANTLNNTILRVLNANNQRVSASAQKNVRKQSENLAKIVADIQQSLWESGLQMDVLDFSIWQSAQKTFLENAPFNQNVQSAILWQSLLDLNQATQNVALWSANLFKQTQESAVLVRKMPKASGNAENLNALYSQSKMLREHINKTQKSIVDYQNNPSKTRLKNMQNNFEKFSLLFNKLKENLRMAQSVLKGGLANLWPVLWQSASCDFLNTWWAKDQWQSFVFYQKKARILTRETAHDWVVIASGAPLDNQNPNIQAPEHYFENCNADSSRANWAENPNEDFCVLPRALDFNDVLAW